MGRFDVLTGFVSCTSARPLLNHQLAPAEAAELIGPWSGMNYLKPFLVFGLPWLIFVAGTSFWAGVRFKKPVMAFLLPVVALFVCAFFLWDWSPSWLSNRWNEVLMILDPSGFRWLNETHLKLDRGAALYNDMPVPFDWVLLVNRGWVLGLGLAGVVGAHRHLTKSLRTGEEGAGMAGWFGRRRYRSAA